MYNQGARVDDKYMMNPAIISSLVNFHFLKLSLTFGIGSHFELFRSLVLGNKGSHNHQHKTKIWTNSVYGPYFLVI